MISYCGTLLACVEQASKDEIWDAAEREVLAKAAEGIAAQNHNLAIMAGSDWDGTEKGFKRVHAGAVKHNLGAGFWVLYSGRSGIRFHAYPSDRGYNIGVV